MKSKTRHSKVGNITQESLVLLVSAWNLMGNCRVKYLKATVIAQWYVYM